MFSIKLLHSVWSFSPKSSLFLAKIPHMMMVEDDGVVREMMRKMVLKLIHDSARGRCDCKFDKCIIHHVNMCAVEITFAAAWLSDFNGKHQVATDNGTRVWHICDHIASAASTTKWLVCMVKRGGKNSDWKKKKKVYIVGEIHILTTLWTIFSLIGCQVGLKYFTFTCRQVKFYFFIQSR